MAMWELAPGAPWNAIFILLMSVILAPCSSASPFCQCCQYPPRGFEVGGRVDPARYGVDDGDVDPHARFQRAKLLQPFLHLQRRGRQLDEALQRRTAIGVEAGVVVAGAATGRRGGA